MLVFGNEKNCDLNNRYDDDAYKSARYFSCNEYEQAVNCAYNQIKYLFRNLLNKEKHIKFDTYKSIEDLRRIQLDANILSYNDYYELASFFDEDEQYSCDLIINEGKMGYRFNKHTENGLERLTFIESEPNLEDEITLMVDMRNKLNEFINEELNYMIEQDITSMKIQEVLNE